MAEDNTSPVVVDTSPVIMQYDVRWGAGNPQTKPLLEARGYCITTQYSYPAMSAKGTMVCYGTRYYGILWKDNGTTYVDYWGFDAESSELTKNCLNIGSDTIAFSMNTSMLADSYAYIQETGQILFAGINSIYYGHTNVNEVA